MTKEQMNLLVQDSAEEFMRLYCDSISPLEYDPLLSNGYCLYFASFLQELFLDGQVVSYQHGTHYFFCYQREYYDNNGCIERYGSILVSQLYGFICIDDLEEIKDVQTEMDYTSCCDLDYKEKQRVWDKISPYLLEYGRKRKDEISTNSKLERKKNLVIYY